MMTEDLTAGQFQAMTGLTAKALRLYGERRIVIPSSIDPVSGYRVYARGQLQHGVTVDLLRRAQVPLSELASGTDFRFERWRQTVELRRHLEDFYLDVAEQVADYDSSDFSVRSTPAPAVDWVGVVVDLHFPEDIEGRIETLAGLAVDTPAVERAFAEALDHLGVAPAEVSWTATPDTASSMGNGQMLLARPVSADLDMAFCDLIADRVRTATGKAILVASGTLPRRVEVTFSPMTTTKLTPAEEAAVGYLHTLAFEDHIARHGLTAIGPTARQVTGSGSSFSDDVPDRPASVFDVHPTPPEDSSG